MNEPNSWIVFVQYNEKRQYDRRTKRLPDWKCKKVQCIHNVRIQKRRQHVLHTLCHNGKGKTTIWNTLALVRIVWYSLVLSQRTKYWSEWIRSMWLAEVLPSQSVRQRFMLWFMYLLMYYTLCTVQMIFLLLLLLLLLFRNTTDSKVQGDGVRKHYFQSDSLVKNSFIKCVNG